MILQVGQILDQRYRVEKFIGSGNMGEVYKVRDSDDTAFALKLLNADLAEDLIFLRRFKREAQTLQQLTHPNIVRFYELVEADHLTFFLMDYVEGITLRNEIYQRRSPFAPERILEIYKPVCSALNFTHRRGVIHCDVKPANIMIEASGKVLLTDFGISRLAEAATTATSFGSAGTPAYMAPELVQGLSSRPATDVYSLGIILFELLSGGERPFTGEAAQITGSREEKVRWEQVNQPPPPIRPYNPQISPDVEQVLLRCLQKDPADRFSSTLELRRSLEMALSEGDQTAFEPPDQATSSLPSGPHEVLPEPVFHPLSSAASDALVYPKPPVDGEPLPPRPISLLERPGLVKLAFLGGILLIGLLLVLLLSQPGLFATPTTPSPAPTQIAANISTVRTSTDIPPTLVLSIIPSQTRPLPTARPSNTPTTVSASTCTSNGLTWIRPKDKTEMVCVAEGSFTMGFPNCNDFWCKNEASQGSVTVASFWIDRYEITNAQFQQFVNDTGFVTGAEQSGFSEVFGTNLPIPGANWRSPQGSGSSISGKTDHPVVQVNWFAANKYCLWVGGRLPGEDQWEKAARGTDGRLFPWGSDMPDKNFLNASGQNDGFRYTAPVGSFPAGKSPYGLYDMAGNAFEWTRSLMKDYPYKKNDGREIETDPGLDDKVILRGGSFYTDYGTVRSTWRAEGPAQRSTDGTGFRCVIDR